MYHLFQEVEKQGSMEKPCPLLFLPCRMKLNILFFFCQLLAFVIILIIILLLLLTVLKVFTFLSIQSRYIHISNCFMGGKMVKIGGFILSQSV